MPRVFSSGIEPRKIVQLQRDRIRGAAQQSCQLDDLRGATVLPAKRNPAVQIERENVLFAGPFVGRK